MLQLLCRRLLGGAHQATRASSASLSVSPLDALSRPYSSTPETSNQQQIQAERQFVKDRHSWKLELRKLRKQYAEDWEKLDKALLKKPKLKRKKGYQPLNREALLESARKRWEENEERKANLRALEKGWVEKKKEKAKAIDKVMDAVEAERQAAEARRLLWLLERSEEWVPEENLDLAIAAAILDPTEI